MKEIIKTALCSGDLFISEMQLLPTGDWSSIFNFYQLNEMREFSRVSFNRIHPGIQSEYCVFLVPVNLDDVGELMVAVTAEKVVDEMFKEQFFITNYCVKPNSHDYRLFWEKGSSFTGDNWGWICDFSIIREDLKTFSNVNQT